MGREGENLAPGAGEPPSAVDAYKASGTAVGGLHGGHDCRSGTKGQPPLVFPRAAGLRGRAAAPAGLAARKRASLVCHVAQSHHQVGEASSCRVAFELDRSQCGGEASKARGERNKGER